MAKSKKTKEIKVPTSINSSVKDIEPLYSEIIGATVRHLVDISSTRFCEECKNDVRIGLGGEANWNTHLQKPSKYFSQGQCAKNGHSSQKTLLSFFNKKEELIFSATESNIQANPALPPVLRPSELFSVSSSHPVHISHEINQLEAGTPHILPGDSSSGLLARFTGVIQSLPDSVLLGTVYEPMGAFSGNPSMQIPEGDDAWETIDCMLNRVIGYGVTIEQLSSIIRRGPFGMDGMYNWVKVCIEELKIDEALPDGKVQCLIDAMLWLYVCPNLRLVLKSERLILICSGANLVHIPPPITKEPPQNHSTIIEPEPAAPTSFKARFLTAEVSCPGYTLKIPDSQSPFTSYPIRRNHCHGKSS